MKNKEVYEFDKYLEIHDKIEKRNKIKEILADFDADLSVGLVRFSGRDIQAPNASFWFHEKCKRIEEFIKIETIKSLERELADIEKWLSERIID